jgi:predicted O-methyltransferase YrrM
MTRVTPARRVVPPTPAKRLRGLARGVGARRVLKGTVRRLGFDLVNRHFYSPVPDLNALTDAFWRRRSLLGGLTFDAEQQLGFIEGELGPHLSEFRPPRDPTEASRFFLDNGTYGAVDAELLYAVIRQSRPGRLIEIGSGFSSLVIGEAIDANRAQGTDAHYEIIDPWPGSASYDMGGADALRRIGELHLTSVLDVPLERFEALQANDVLFVDTTHTVKVGGDVNRIVLDILPRLAPGVIVHFHDIFLPWEYPREWVEQQEWYWAEQYLVQAFLAFNSAFEVQVAAHWLWRSARDRLEKSIPTAARAFPLALWLRRRA